MRDAFPVSGIQSVQNLARIFDGLFQWKRTSQRSPIDELHHEVVRTDIIEMANVGMVERTNYARFLSEALTELAGADLDRHLAVEAHIRGAVDFAHTAFAEQRGDFVRPEFLADTDRHRTGGL